MAGIRLESGRIPPKMVKGWHVWVLIAGFENKVIFL